MTASDTAFDYWSRRVNEAEARSSELAEEVFRLRSENAIFRMCMGKVRLARSLMAQSPAADDQIKAAYLLAEACDLAHRA